MLFKYLPRKLKYAYMAGWRDGFMAGPFASCPYSFRGQLLRAYAWNSGRHKGTMEGLTLWREDIRLREANEQIMRDRDKILKFPPLKYPVRSGRRA